MRSIDIYPEFDKNIAFDFKRNGIQISIPRPKMKIHFLYIMHSEMFLSFYIQVVLIVVHSKSTVQAKNDSF